MSESIFHKWELSVYPITQFLSPKHFWFPMQNAQSLCFKDLSNETGHEPPGKCLWRFLFISFVAVMELADWLLLQIILLISQSVSLPFAYSLKQIMFGNTTINSSVLVVYSRVSVSCP